MSSSTVQPTRKFLAAGLGSYQTLDPTVATMYGGPVGVYALIEEEKRKAAVAGWEVVALDVNPLDPDAAVAAWKDVLRGGHFTIASIGFGVRKNLQWTALFERLVNAAVETSPSTKLGFAQGPGDLTATITRLFPDVTF